MGLLYLAIVGVSLYLGVNIKNRLKSKASYYSALIRFLDLYKQNLLYSQDVLEEFIKKVNIRTSREFLKTLDSFKTSMFLDRRELELPDNLENEEKVIIQNFFNFLGNSSGMLEAELVDKVRVEIDEHKKIAEDKFNRFGNLAVKVSLLLGFLVVILLI